MNPTGNKLSAKQLELTVRIICKEALLAYSIQKHSSARKDNVSFLINASACFGHY
jgi:hypothetical protein